MELSQFIITTSISQYGQNNIGEQLYDVIAGWMDR